MDELSCDVLVIGSGAAGLRAAISAARLGSKVFVLSKGSPGMGTSTLMSGGTLAGAVGGFTPEEHWANTLQAGRGINQVHLVEAFIKDAPERLEELREWGLRGITRRGALHAEGRPLVWGEEIVRCLLAQSREMRVELLGGLTVQSIVAGEGGTGALTYCASTGKWTGILAGSLVLATGGAGALFHRHDNPQRMLGEGYTLALEAGARLQDMEFVQFYPLGLAEPGVPLLLVPPRMADQGRLTNGRGEDLLVKYGIHERPAAIKARDRLSQALFREISREGQEVWLDLQGLSEEVWKGDPLSASMRQPLGEKYGASQRPLRVAPMAHFVMGGVSIDAVGSCSVEGLYAAGEVAGGLHGANRMGGNALTETLVFGARAGEAAARWARNAPSLRREKVLQRLRSAVPQFGHSPSPGRSRPVKAKLKRILWQDGGIFRTAGSLSRAIDAVLEMNEELREAGSPQDRRELQGLLELRLAARTALWILKAALRREESRGSHFREDFPSPDDGRWLGSMQLSLSPDGQEIWSFHPTQKTSEA